MINVHCSFELFSLQHGLLTLPRLILNSLTFGLICIQLLCSFFPDLAALDNSIDYSDERTPLLVQDEQAKIYEANNNDKIRTTSQVLHYHGTIQLKQSDHLFIEYYVA